MRHCAGFALGLTLILAAGSSRADDYRFSFIGTQVGSDGNGLQTVTGEIFGLGDDGFYRPDHVTVDAPEFDFSSTDPFTTLTGGFQVSDGEIISASFMANSGDRGCGSGCGLQLTNSSNSANFGSGNFVIDSSGSPAAFTRVSPVVSAAPEPEAWLLMLTGVGLLGLYLRRAKGLLLGLPSTA